MTDIVDQMHAFIVQNPKNGLSLVFEGAIEEILRLHKHIVSTTIGLHSSSGFRDPVTPMDLIEVQNWKSQLEAYRSDFKPAPYPGYLAWD